MSSPLVTDDPSPPLPAPSTTTGDSVTEVQVRPIDPPTSTSAQDIAALGALLTSAGLTKLQVQSLVARIQKVSEQVALITLNETLEDIRKIQESRIWRIISLIQALPSMGGYINKNSVLMAVQTVASETPRQ
jgi:hypothetical protein